MRERLDLGSAVRDALPVYAASPALRAWATEETRKLDEDAITEGVSQTRARARFWGSSRLRIAAGLVLAAFTGWGVGSFRPTDRSSSTDRTTKRVDRRACSIALARAPAGCRLERQAHGKAVVCRQDRYCACSGRSFPTRISAARG